LKTRKERIDEMILLLKKYNQRVNYRTRNSETKLRKRLSQKFSTMKSGFRGSCNLCKRKIYNDSSKILENRKYYSKNRNILRKIIIQRDSETCFKCKTTENLSIDHIRPLSKLGTNDLSNLQILCRKCNVIKGDYYEDRRK